MAIHRSGICTPDFDAMAASSKTGGTGRIPTIQSMAKRGFTYFCIGRPSVPLSEQLRATYEPQVHPV